MRMTFARRHKTASYQNTVGMLVLHPYFSEYRTSFLAEINVIPQEIKSGMQAGGTRKYTVSKSRMFMFGGIPLGMAGIVRQVASLQQQFLGQGQGNPRLKLSVG